ncbi:enoyl-CoA hydratase [Corynebacterium sp. 13CS0277]|uniref:enoyl-CoA hydratase n=1 Tax=Corynebacterium sp. 13CS0277 TaxID=2071994 RepID=UPI000D0394B4|nr:enoyl-CoA hydratase [Corynebacterium sp. 13CS0277]PRQ11005.1 enoyl-CoA hydratase [Corynebacterium sp. 13CS0277]
MTQSTPDHPTRHAAHEELLELLAQHSSPVLRAEVDGFVLILTITREEKRNALNEETCEEISRLLRAVAAVDGHAPVDPPIRAVLMRGEGKAFCAGADLSGAVYGDTFHDALHGMLRALVEFPYPVVADVQGPAVGAGTQLSLACDLRVVGERGWFMVPPAKLGFALDNWTLRRTEHLVGGAWARTIMLAGARVGQEEARLSGFASATGDSAAALEFAHQVAAGAPLSLKHLKDVLNDGGYGFTLPEAQQRAYEECWASADAQEARDARADKRPPRFRGR